MTVGNYGSAVFQVSSNKVLTWSECSITRRSGWQEMDILCAKDKLQWNGTKLASVRLTVQLNASFLADVSGELDRFAKMLVQPQAYTLVLGGRHLGKYVLEEANETITTTDRAGNPTAATLQLSLKEYN